MLLDFAVEGRIGQATKQAEAELARRPGERPDFGTLIGDLAL
jgi:hypothetical protein